MMYKVRIQLIDKATIVAEIKKRLKEAESNCGGYKSYDEHRCDNCTVGFYEEFLEIIDALEVKEIDLEKDIKDYIYKIPHAKTGIPGGWKYSWDEEKVIEIAKYFFELGLNSQTKDMVDALRMEYEKGKADVVKKACEFLKSYRQDTPDGTGYIAGIIDDKTIKEFKKMVGK